MAFDISKEWGDADVAALLGSVEDDRDWRLEVGKDAIVSLHDMTVPTGTEYDATMHCFFEMWSQGTDWVGPGAASDKKLVATIAKKLRENWPNLVAGQTLYA
ncbi:MULTISPECIES: hypothetical protein [Derxia]|uniref:Uncharacterized protein n=1 Tax=Derxia gummosa DSM 723 TaxID=1121388 RepID=A0A8B6X680_9BURK|nr:MULTISPECIES: hypothetical protein [Derxia]